MTDLEPRPPVLRIGTAALTGAVAMATLPPEAPGWVGVGTIVGLALAWRLAGRDRAGRILRRGILVGPFILFLAAIEFFRDDAHQDITVAGLVVPIGAVRAACVLLKTVTAVSLGLAWGECVGAHGVARSLQRIRAPSGAVAVAFITVNFLSLIAREWEGVRQAARARGLNRAGVTARLRQFGASLMSVLVRSIWRGERVAFAMRARGYAGRLPSPVIAGRESSKGRVLLPAAAIVMAAVAVLARTIQ